MKVLSIVGNSKAGKTTLIERLVPILSSKGLRILVIKHAKAFEVDRKGKDSWRIFNAGADVVVSSQHELFYRARIRDDLEEICKLFGFYDLIITEGFNKACKDRIVVVRDPKDLERFMCGNILAVVCDGEIRGFKTFRLDQVEDLAEVILDWYYSPH